LRGGLNRPAALEIARRSAYIRGAACGYGDKHVPE